MPNNSRTQHGRENLIADLCCEGKREERRERDRGRGIKGERRRGGGERGGEGENGRGGGERGRGRESVRGVER